MAKDLNLGAEPFGIGRVDYSHFVIAAVKFVINFTKRTITEIIE